MKDLWPSASRFWKNQASVRRGQEPKTLSKRAHNPYGLESAKPDLQSGFSKPGGDIPGPWIWVTVCSGMGEIAIRGGYWGGRRAMGGEMDTAARCGAGFSGCQDHPWDSLNSTRSRSRRAPRAGCDMAKACENSFRMGSHRPWG